MNADEFNRTYSIGTPMLYEVIQGYGKERVKTCSAAWELADGQPVVLVDHARLNGRSASLIVAVRHLFPVGPSALIIPFPGRAA